MQSNKECMKDILKYIINNTKVKIEEDNKNISILSIGIFELISDLTKDKKYQKEEVVYNILKCHKYRLIEANIPMVGNVITTAKCNICDITIAGEKFLNDELEL